MVSIRIIDGGTWYDLNCENVDGSSFSLRISKQGSLLVKPQKFGMEESMAYFHVKNMIEDGETIPDQTVAAWG